MSGLVMKYSVKLAITSYIVFFFLNFYSMYLLSSILRKLKLNNYIKINLNVSFLISLFWTSNVILLLILVITLVIGKIYIFEFIFIKFICLFILDLVLDYLLKKVLYVGGRRKTGIIKMI